jgi:hypothetical protein
LQGHDLPRKIIDWRQVSKLKSTYTDALPTYINAQTGRIHTSYSMAATSTGRLSSNEPNLQNIPIRTKEGREIRTAFVAPKGMRLISADYSQVELRLLAHCSGDPRLQQLLMGEGKSSVVSPLLVLCLAGAPRLVASVVPASLLKQSVGTLHALLRTPVVQKPVRLFLDLGALQKITEDVDLRPVGLL